MCRVFMLSLPVRKLFVYLVFFISLPASSTGCGLNQNPSRFGFELKTVIVSGIPSWFTGQSLSLNADINSDGKNDLIVGANGGGMKRQGAVYIFYRPEFEKLTELQTADVEITGEESNDQFGWSLTTEGDLNGDGISDLVVSALGHNRIGKVYVFLGGKNYSGKQLSAAEADYIISSADSTETFGFVICADGDLNNDGINDLVVSAPSNSDAAKEAGKIYIFNGGGWGKNITASDAACVITGEMQYSSFGSSVTFGGDFTGSGTHDLAIGSYFASMDSANSGRVYLFEGRRLWPQRAIAQQADIIFTGYRKESWLGTAVEMIGDINNDGTSELIAGASGENVGGDDAGAAYLFYGGKRSGRVSVNNANLKLASSRTGNNFGTQIVRAGDIDGDGREDWIISEPGGIIAQENAKGRIYLFLTSMRESTEISSVIEDPFTKNNFGCSVSVGDITGDGIPEIGVGANWDNAAGSRSGKVVIFTIQQ